MKFLQKYFIQTLSKTKLNTNLWNLSRYLETSSFKITSKHHKPQLLQKYNIEGKTHRGIPMVGPYLGQFKLGVGGQLLLYQQ